MPQSNPIILEHRKLPRGAVLTVEIVETREWKVRLWVAQKLLVLAAMVLGCRIEFGLGRKAPND